MSAGKQSSTFVGVRYEHADANSDHMRQLRRNTAKTVVFGVVFSAAGSVAGLVDHGVVTSLNIEFVEKIVWQCAFHQPRVFCRAGVTLIAA
ncbi:hypothetical protein CCHOA_08140 [Corynebacterium choanae]|uniref:Uncharacterized protein n=1 Tax=Corynebacterium choanae TaxID=1862358 RepID=A0A3G6J7Z6_9CORY|nr:hypothetical protein CCHOA_08140 [Corynebacterium choanae]